ncbi:MAG: ribosome maturation factor RimM [Bacteroidales bacterium]|nr:ribosome maturation factor RimM [Bacteroidales bacterium]
MKFDELELFEVASVIKPHGLNGYISIKTFENYSNKIYNIGMPVFLKIEGIPVPFFIEDVKTSGRNVLLKLKNICNSEQVDRFRSASLMITEKDIIENKSEELSKSELIGYAVYDVKFGFIGNISLFNDIPGNPVFETTFDNKTIIIPFADDIIVEINSNTKTVKIIAPEGLIDIYLNK